MCGVELSAEEAERAFAQMDEDGSGTASFDEFCTWIARRQPAQQLAEAAGEPSGGAGGSDAAVLAPAQTAPRHHALREQEAADSATLVHASSAPPDKAQALLGAAREPNTAAPPCSPVARVAADGHTTLQLKLEEASTPSAPRATEPQPAGLLTMPSKKERDALFKQMDGNGNGALSLAEIDVAVQRLWPTMHNRKALMRAYKAADRNGNGLVDRREFRLLLEYLSYFNDLWAKFVEIDGGARGDGRLTPEEFGAGCRVCGVELSAEEAERAFAQMDEDGSGTASFEEFCTWIARQNLSKSSSASTRSPAAGVVALSSHSPTGAEANHGVVDAWTPRSRGQLAPIDPAVALNMLSAVCNDDEESVRRLCVDKTVRAKRARGLARIPLARRRCYGLTV